MSGPPGSGKTMLAQCLPSILPPLAQLEAIEVTRIQSIAGMLQGCKLAKRRPFRAPHHTITTAGLIGSATPNRVGEIVLAHHGVLFLDELTEFNHISLEALRQPLEDGEVTIVRAAHTSTYPTRFSLIAATNPCPCGYAGDPARCHCSPRAVSRYQRRLSGPLLDRIDLLAIVRRPALSAGSTATTEAARLEVAEARERQSARVGSLGIVCNAELPVAQLPELTRVTSGAREVLNKAYDCGLVTARGHDRVLRVARTVADLDRRDGVEAKHVLKALSLRPDGLTNESKAA
jgi:magnesium chelatase family protein